MRAVHNKIINMLTKIISWLTLVECRRICRSQDTIDKQSFHHMWSLTMRMPKTVCGGGLLNFDNPTFDNTFDSICCIESSQK